MCNLNHQNGGLLVRVRDTLLITDIYTYKGLLALEESKITKVSQSIPWFMNKDSNGDNLYYSDQANGDKLCKINLDEREEKVVVDDPVYLVTLHNNTLYYIHQEDNKLYRCDKQGKYKEIIINDNVKSYSISNQKIWYATSAGIWCCNLESFDKQKICSDTGESIVYLDGKIAFCNQSRQYCITIVDLTDFQQYDIENSCATSINIHGKYIFFSHKKDKCALYRYNSISQDNIKFASEATDYIHILEDSIIFYDSYETHEWMKVPVNGGKAIRLYNHKEMSL